jgi:hypothetical protein
MKKIFGFIFAIILIGCLFFGCDADADVASYNISKAADQFEIFRRVVFYNGITDEYILVVEGYCSIYVDTVDNQLELTVKTDAGTYLKHYLGLSDNVTYFAEQLQPAEASTQHYRVIFKPSVIIPIIDLE